MGANRLYEFGPFRLDPEERRLLRGDQPVALTPKCFDLLVVLVENGGHLLGKEELLERLWSGQFVEEVNLSFNISSLRKALGEGQNGQRYIETIPKRGYRFVADIGLVRDQAASLHAPELPGLHPRISGGGQAARGNEVAAEDQPAGRKYSLARLKVFRERPFLTLSVLMVLAVGLLYLMPRPPMQPRIVGSEQITNNGLNKLGLQNAALSTSPVTDGARLYFSQFSDGAYVLTQVSVAGGETVGLASPLHNIWVQDISHNGAELLVSSHVTFEHEAPLWILPVLGGSPRRLGDLVGHGAAWSRDGQRIVYANGSELFIAGNDGTDSRKLVTTQGRIQWPRWSPDGSRLRFTVQDPKSNSPSLWEVVADGSNLHPLLPGWNNPAAECCGNWTPDGRYFVFQSTRNWATNVWAIREQSAPFMKADRAPVQLTFGPLNFYAPVPSKAGSKLFVIGEQQRGELVRYDTKTKQFVNHLSGISAEHLDFSKDGEWIAYVTIPEANLWRSRADGTQRLQLTAPPMRAALPRWSPDGRRLVFAARAATGKPQKMYLISADGGPAKQLLTEERSEGNPDWSPEGTALLFTAGSSATGFALYILDLETGQVSKVSGSDGLMGSRWSPDGRYIAAQTVGGRKSTLFDFTTQRWAEWSDQNAGWLQWSRDGKYLYFASFHSEDPALFRMRIEDRKIEPLANLKGIRLAMGSKGEWVGWTPGGSPLMVRDVGTQDVYALEWAAP